MSRDARDWAWLQDVPPTEKLVLLALAERTNDAGICWPSIQFLATTTGLCDRSVQKALRALTEKRLISITSGGGRATNRYALQIECSVATGEPAAPPYQIHRSDEVDSPQGRDTDTAGVKLVHPNRKRTVSEPSVNPNRSAVRARDVPLPAWIEPSTWQAFLDHRRCIKAPMSEVAQQRALAALERLRDEGQDAEAVLNQSIVNGWKGLFPVKAGSPGAASTFDSNVSVLRSMFGEEHGQEDIPGGAGVSGSGVRHPAPARADGRVLGPTRRAAR